MEPGTNPETRPQQLQRLEDIEHGVMQQVRDAEHLLELDKDIQKRQRELLGEQADNATAFEQMVEDSPAADNDVVTAETGRLRQDSEVLNAAANVQETNIKDSEQRLQGAQETLKAIKQLRSDVIDEMTEDEAMQ